MATLAQPGMADEPKRPNIAKAGLQLPAVKDYEQVDREIMGTLQYMAPEQLNGQEQDGRADIFAFGCILYELLTGQRLFQGESVVEVLGGVLNKAPDLSKAPARVHRLLEWCLEKDRKQRLASISDARKLLEEVPAEAAHTAQVVQAKRAWVPWAVAGA